MIINGNDYDTKDGTTVRDFIHVTDIAEMHLLASKNLNNDFSSKSEIFNCGYGVGYSIKEVVDEMNIILKENIKFEFGQNSKPLESSEI